MKDSGSNFRIHLVFSFFCLALLLVFIQLIDIQILRHKYYQSLGQDQYWDAQELPAKRGDIVSSDGFVLAGTQLDYLLYAEPKVVENKPDVAQKLTDFFLEPKFAEISTESSGSADELKLAKYELKDRLLEKYKSALYKDLLWVPLERNVSSEDKNKLENFQIKGLGFEEYPMRYYPEQTLAAHVLGFTAGGSTEERQGYYGIEGKMNEDLKGKAGRVVEEKDATGTPILVGGYRRVMPIQGSTIFLTINRSLQYMVEKRLKEGVETYDAKFGSVIVMDPNTGDVLAMANYPTYFPDNLPQKDIIVKDTNGRKLYETKNLSISETYEPGSVIKPLTVATALDQKLVTPETTFEDNGPVNYSGYLINNWDGKHYGELNIIQLLQKSNNIGAAWVGHKVGAKSLSQYFKNFGVGDKTNILLEGEDTGNIRPYKEWTDIDLANISFGQGMSATPLQVLTAFNVFANGGFLLQPRIISRIVDNGKNIDFPTKNVRKVLTKETALTMTTILEKAAEGGEAQYFVLKDYKIAGKTGTAQIFENGKYDPNKTNATFVGYLSGKKRISMIVRLAEPTPKIFASETAVPLWMGIISDITKYYGLTPDKTTK